MRSWARTSGTACLEPERLEPERLTRPLVKRLEALGHKVTLEPRPAASVRRGNFQSSPKRQRGETVSPRWRFGLGLTRRRQGSVELDLEDLFLAVTLDGHVDCVALLLS